MAYRFVAIAVVLAVSCTAVHADFAWSGKFAGHYPSKTCLDVVSVARTGFQFNATKVTGTAAVPAGKTSFYFRDSPNADGTYSGYGQMAQSGYVNPYWTGVLLTIIDDDSFSVTQDPAHMPSSSSDSPWPSSTFHRWFEVCKSVDYLTELATGTAKEASGV